MVAATLAAGAPIAPVMVFLISTRLMSPSVFFVTLGGLGVSITMWKLMSAVVLGLAAGWVTDRLSKQGYLRKSILRVKSYPQEQDQTAACSTSGRELPGMRRRKATIENVRAFLRLTRELSFLIGKPTIIAVIAQAVVIRFVPHDLVSAALGVKSSYSVLISTIAAIPMYLGNMGAVPLLRSLMDLGMDRGAVLAFIIAGPIICIPSILAGMALFERRALYIYLAFGFFGALIFGYTYRLLQGCSA